MKKILCSLMVLSPMILAGCTAPGDSSPIDKYWKPFVENWWGIPVFIIALILFWVIRCLIRGKSIWPF